MSNLVTSFTVGDAIRYVKLTQLNIYRPPLIVGLISKKHKDYDTSDNGNLLFRDEINRLSGVWERKGLVLRKPDAFLFTFKSTSYGMYQDAYVAAACLFDKTDGIESFKLGPTRFFCDRDHDLGEDGRRWLHITPDEEADVKSEILIFLKNRFVRSSAVDVGKTSVSMTIKGTPRKPVYNIDSKKTKSKKK